MTNLQQILLISSLVLFLLFQICTSLDTIYSNQSISDGDLLISNGENFALGFFSPGSSSNRYVGIWYHKIPEQTVVWVANRDNPINDTSGVLSISQDGNLVLHAQNVPLWSSNVSVLNRGHCEAQLLNSGNLIVIQANNKEVIWQSFEHPTNTMLPFMKLGLDKKTGLNQFLTSWKSADDPGTGECSYRFNTSGSPQLFLHKGSVRLWRTGPWNGLRWSGVIEMTRNFIFNASFVNTRDEVYATYGILNSSIFSRLMVNESGVVERQTWHEGDRRWIGFWSAPKDRCDYYNNCGSNSNCNPYIAGDFECKCLPGYEPKSPRDWFLRDGSDGCVRKRIQSSKCWNGGGFVKVVGVKVPDTSTARLDMLISLNSCEQECLNNCSCTGYTSADVRGGGSGCITWYGDLVDTREYPSGGQDLYIRVDAVELAQNSKKSRSILRKKSTLAILAVSIVVMLLLLAFGVYYLVRRQEKGTGNWTSFDVSQGAEELDGSSRHSDLPFFDLSTIAAATDNFSVAKKLGEGGFGSVYKGQLSNGQEIAVKRLSKTSGQGTEEFKNEVTLIAKLQHRNLVRLIGCCIQKEEKMLIYEYLPNKSLDYFVFNESKRSLLDWTKRFEIICGIARGILYLHQDSRLRIIHRDIKASNVLLDATLNPKISDFGMARIFGGEQMAANTNRVVGTYGYMSPEYAMQGLFSIKSDVYSFGVLLLEIITGRKNSGLYQDQSSSLNLTGHVWNLWKEGKLLGIVDSLLGETFPAHEVLKCIQIGLLCVQEHATDRPTMSTVVFMLGNDATLPPPKEPAFIIRGAYKGTSRSTTSEGTNSVNEMTVSILEAR